MARLHQQLLYIAALAAATLLAAADALSISSDTSSHKHMTTPNPSSRRNFVQFGLVAATTIPTMAANAAVDAQFKEVGQQERPPEGETPFSTLSDGVQIKDFRQGSGSDTVKNGSRVELTMKGRLLNLNGVIFYDTKSNDPNGFGEGTPLQFTVGDKTVLPGLESGLIGMSKGGIRRIIVPAEVGYGAFPGLEPQPLTEVERRALDSVVKNPRRDQTVMFDVKVERLR